MGFWEGSKKKKFAQSFSSRKERRGEINKKSSECLNQNRIYQEQRVIYISTGLRQRVFLTSQSESKQRPKTRPKDSWPRGNSLWSSNRFARNFSLDPVLYPAQPRDHAASLCMDPPSSILSRCSYSNDRRMHSCGHQPSRAKSETSSPHPPRLHSLSIISSRQIFSQSSQFAA